MDESNAPDREEIRRRVWVNGLGFRVKGFRARRLFMNRDSKLPQNDGTEGAMSRWVLPWVILCSCDINFCHPRCS